jgi:alginate O-acetyltransferase complex protein AlgJ
VGSLVDVGSDAARIELRRPARLPSLPDSWESLRELPDRVDAYLDDAFGFRAQLVTANSLLHLAIGVSGSSRYVVGRDGWFFHRSADDVLEQYRGTDTFKSDEVDRWIETMQGREAWLAQRGIDFLVVIAPIKQAIYPEFLPEWVNVVGPTRYQQLRARADGLSFDVLDLHEPLRTAKQLDEDRLYFKTDGHWNDLGAFVGYQEIARWIRARHPRVRVLDRADFSLT